jgi:hypothetical protein
MFSAEDAIQTTLGANNLSASIMNLSDLIVNPAFINAAS